MFVSVDKGDTHRRHTTHTRCKSRRVVVVVVVVVVGTKIESIVKCEYGARVSFIAETLLMVVVSSSRHHQPTVTTWDCYYHFGYHTFDYSTALEQRKK